MGFLPSTPATYCSPQRNGAHEATRSLLMHSCSKTTRFFEQCHRDGQSMCRSDTRGPTQHRGKFITTIVSLQRQLGSKDKQLLNKDNLLNKERDRHTDQNYRVKTRPPPSLLLYYNSTTATTQHNCHSTARPIDRLQPSCMTCVDCDLRFHFVVAVARTAKKIPPHHHPHTHMTLEENTHVWVKKKKNANRPTRALLGDADGQALV